MKSSSNLNFLIPSQWSGSIPQHRFMMSVYSVENNNNQHMNEIPAKKFCDNWQSNFLIVLLYRLIWVWPLTSFLELPIKRATMYQFSINPIKVSKFPRGFGLLQTLCPSVVSRIFFKQISIFIMIKLFIVIFNHINTL